jgi:GT2 family glycosyltransferase
MDLSIIIINWNSVTFLRRCIKSIYSQIKDIKFEIIVVDNASYDGSDELIQNDFTDVKFIQSNENIGFAKANNLAYKYSSGRNLLFLNPDTEIIGPAINTMIAYLEKMPDAGAIGCKLLNSDMTLDTSCVQPFPTILNQALDIEYLKVRFPKVKLWKSNPLLSIDGNPLEVEVIIGACIMIKRSLFENIGLFSTDYFMFAEDLDLCYKIHQAGYKTYYVSEAKIIHHAGGSTKNKQKNDFKIVMMRESVLMFLKKSKGSFYANLYRLVTAFSAIFRLIILSIVKTFRNENFNNKDLYISIHKWKKILGWSIGLENWTQQYIKD